MRLDIANLAWQLPGDAALVRAVAQGDVAAMVEARDHDDDPVPVAAILGAPWKVLQRLRAGDVAGSVLAVRRTSPVKVARWRSWRASRAAAAGGGVQDRYALTVVLVERQADIVLETHLVVVHPPLRGTGRQDDAVRAVGRLVARAIVRRSTVQNRRTPVRRKRIVRWAVVGDFNMPHEQMRAHLAGAGSLGAEVMGFVHGPGWGHPHCSTRTRPESDHPILRIDA